MKILFTVLSGSYERMVYGLAEELQRKSDAIQPVILWYTKAFRSQPVSYPELSTRMLLKRYPIPGYMEDAYYRALRYKTIDLMDVIRINMIDTPEIKVERLLRWSIRYLYACERMLEDCEIQAVVLLLGRGLFQRCLGLMARSMRINTFYLCDAFIPGRTVHIWRSEEEVTDDLKGLNLPSLNTDQKQELTCFIRQLTQVKTIGVSPYKSPWLKKTLSFIRLFFRHENLVGNKSAWDFVWHETLRVFRRYMMKRYYKPVPRGRFIYLPLQVFYDFQIPLLWAEYTNIEYLVEAGRRSLPPGYTLVVKEHPHLCGCYPVNVLRRVSRMQDVILVDVDMDSRELVEHCDTVFTICSSTGWQAMMYHTPVVMVTSRSHPGYRYYYGDYDVTVNVDEDELKEGFRQAVHGSVDQDRIDSFLYHVIMARYKGEDWLCPVEYTRMTEGDGLRVVSEYLFSVMKGEMKTCLM